MVLLLPPWRRFFALIPFGPRKGAEPKRAYFSKVFLRGTLSFEGSPSPTSINTRRCAKKQMEHTLESSSAHNEVPAPMGAGRGGDYSKALLRGCLLSSDHVIFAEGCFSLSQCGAPGADTPLSQCLPHVSCTSTYMRAPPGIALLCFLHDVFQKPGDIANAHSFGTRFQGPLLVTHSAPFCPSSSSSCGTSGPLCNNSVTFHGDPIRGRLPRAGLNGPVRACCVCVCVRERRTR